MPYPVAPTVPGFEGPRPLPPSYGPQQPMPPSTPLPPIPVTQYVAPPQNQPVTPQNASGGLPVPIYTGSNTAPWASPTGQGYFGSGGGRLPSLAGMFNSIRQGISNNRFAQGLLGSLVGGTVAGPAGSVIGGLYGPRFLGGTPSYTDTYVPLSLSDIAADQSIIGAPRTVYGGYPGSMRNTSPADLAALQARFDAQSDPENIPSPERLTELGEQFEDRLDQMRTAWGARRGGAGFVTGEIAPGSLGIFEGSRMDESRAPQTAAQNQMR